MTERGERRVVWATWVLCLGACVCGGIGILTVLAWQRVMSEPYIAPVRQRSNPSRRTYQHLQTWCKRCPENKPRIV
jgi:hypothetical protein